MLGTENTCSYETVSMCQNNKNLHNYKLLLHSDLLLGKCNTSSNSFTPVCSSERIFCASYTQKTPLHLFHLGFNVKLQIPAIMWNIAAKGKGNEAQIQK